MITNTVFVPHNGESMSNKFSYKEMEEFASLVSAGETTNTFHCKTGHGNDRCYVTHKGDVVLAYCHHCGAKGSYKVGRAAYKQHKAKAPKPVYHNSHLMPQDINEIPAKWPIEAIKWVIDGGLSLQEAQQQGFVWSEKLGRVLIPMYLDGYEGWLGRRINGDGPKYLLKVVDKESFVYHIKTNESRVVVLVEDVLSALHVAKAGYNVIALLGTALQDRHKKLLLDEKYIEFYVWLDNDKRQVKLNQARIRRDLLLYGEAHLVKTDDDPKHCDVKGVLGEAVDGEVVHKS